MASQGRGFEVSSQEAPWIVSFGGQELCGSCPQLYVYTAYGTW